MKKRVKIIFTSAMLIFSFALMSFGVFAASQNTLGVMNFISFDVGDNISCDINALSAIGTTPEVTFDGQHNDAKTIDLTITTGGTQFSKVSGNTDISSNIWSPWTESDKALLGLTNDTVYWMFKITNTCENPIQVSLTDTENNTLHTLDHSLKLYKNYGTVTNEVPSEAMSTIAKTDETIIVLVAMEAVLKKYTVSDNWNFKLCIEKAVGISFLEKGWRDELTTKYTTINFVGGDGLAYSGNGTETYHLGATDNTGSTALAEETDELKDIIGYVDGSTLDVYSPGKIYAPVDSTYLFAGMTGPSDPNRLQQVTTLTLENFDTSNVENMTRMFQMTSVTSLDFSQFDTRNVTVMYAMFQGASIVNLDLSSFDTSEVNHMSHMFNAYTKLQTLNVSNFNTMKVTTMENMFYNCTGLTTLDLSSFYTPALTTTYNMFAGARNIRTIDISNFDTSNITTMQAMFSVSAQDTKMALESVDVSGFDTRNVTNMRQMFQGCYSLTNLDVANWNTSKVTNMGYMFYGLKASTLAVENWDVSEVTDMTHMFNDTSLERLDLSRWDTSSVRNMSCMFNNSAKLTYLDVSGLDTQNVTSMAEMFEALESLQTLDISNLDTTNVTNFDGMFGDEGGKVLGLTTLILGDFDTTDANIEGIFDGLVNVTRLEIGNYTGHDIDISALGLKLNGVDYTTITEASSSNIVLTK